MKPTTTETYSRSSITLIKCQVFYSKDTLKIGGMSIADYMFTDVTDVSGQDNTNACEDVNSISFEQRTLKSRGDYERKALWSREVLAEHLFSTLFSARVSRYLFFIHAQCVMVARQPFGWLKGRVNRKEFPRHPHVPYHHSVLCVLGCTRATLMYSLCSSRLLPFWCGWCEASGNTGCELVTGQSLDIYRWWSWLLLWIQNPRVHSSMVRAADCRSAGPWFNSGWRSWCIFMTGSDILMNHPAQRYNTMSPIRTVITTITRKSVNMVAELDYDTAPSRILRRRRFFF